MSKRYVIISMNQLQGHFKGHFNDLHLLFMKSVDDRRVEDDGVYITWTSIIGDAISFASEEDAWQAIGDTYRGELFSLTNFAVLSVDEKGLEYYKREDEPLIIQHLEDERQKAHDKIFGLREGVKHA